MNVNDVIFFVYFVYYLYLCGGKTGRCQEGGSLASETVIC